MSVAPDENSTTLKFGDDRFRDWGTVPPNDPQNCQIRAFSCTVAERVIRLRRFSAECWSRQGNIVLKCSDDRSRGWGTVPQMSPQNGQIRAFSCTVAKCVIDLRLFFGTQMSVHYAYIVLEQEPDRRKDGATVPPKLGKFLPLDAYVEISRERCEIRSWCQ